MKSTIERTYAIPAGITIGSRKSVTIKIPRPITAVAISWRIFFIILDLFAPKR
jgi:hypothetical protein